MKSSQQVGFGSRGLAKEGPGSCGRSTRCHSSKMLPVMCGYSWACFAIGGPVLVSTQSRDLLKHCKRLCKAEHPMAEVVLEPRYEFMSLDKQSGHGGAHCQWDPGSLVWETSDISPKCWSPSSTGYRNRFGSSMLTNETTKVRLNFGLGHAASSHCPCCGTLLLDDI